jgi:hypothetical protein
MNKLNWNEMEANRNHPDWKKLIELYRALEIADKNKTALNWKEMEADRSHPDWKTLIEFYNNQKG